MSALVLTEPVVSPTKASPAGIYVYHNVEDAISVGVKLAKDGAVTVALAVCAPRDQFSRPRAQFILRARLEACKTDRGGLTFSLGNYSGSAFKDEVFLPLMKYVRDNAYLFLVRDEPDGPSSRDQRGLLETLVDELSGLKSHPHSNLR